MRMTAGALLVSCAMAAWGAPKAVKPVVHATGYEVIALVARPSMYWVDNDRLLFVGMKAGYGPRADLRKTYAWDGKTGGVNLAADSQSFCSSRGSISYDVEKASTPSEAIRSNFTCKTHLRSELVPRAAPFRQVVVLRDGDGYLDIQPGGGPDLIDQLKAPKKNLVLYQAGGNAIELPLTWDENFSPSDIAYSDYRGAYVLRPRSPRGAPIGISGSWPKGRPVVVYLLWPNGKTERVSIPYSITDHLVGPRPTVVGWIFGGGRTPQTVGLYVFDGKAAAKLDVGSVKEVAVAVNGCKAAVAIQNKPFEMGTPTNLKVFDFCAEGR